MPASHQFGNFSERQISQAKKILNSLREDVNASIYVQHNTLEELYGKLFSVEAVMNSRPILLSNKDSDAMLICPKMLLSPYLTAAQLQSWVLDVLSPLTNPSNIASLIAKNHQVVASALQEALWAYLQSEGLRYSVRQGDNSKPDLQNLQPMIQDIVLFKTSEQKFRFGIITTLKPKNIVTLKTTHHGVVQMLDKHVRLLILLYRE